MLKNIERGEWKKETWYELVFDDGRGDGYSFPCDEDGNVKPLEFQAAIDNLEFCRAHPEMFVRFAEVVPFCNRYREPDRGTCRCGEVVELWDQYFGACQCPKCGQWYNLFGQELLPPEEWEEDW